MYIQYMCCITHIYTHTALELCQHKRIYVYIFLHVRVYISEHGEKDLHARGWGLVCMLHMHVCIRTLHQDGTAILSQLYCFNVRGGRGDTSAGALFYE